jgi:hypothetical protein
MGLVNVSVAFSTCKIVYAVVAYRATIDSLHEVSRENGDDNVIAKAEETMLKSLDELAGVCEVYISKLSPVVDLVEPKYRPLLITAYRDLEAAILSTNLADNSTKAAMKAYFMTRSAIGSIERALEALSTI